MDDFLFDRDGKKPFLETAAAAGLEVGTTPPFENGDAIPGVGLLRAAHRFAFSNPIGTVTPEPIEDEQAIWSFRVMARMPAGPIPFEEVEDQVRAAAEENARRDKARELLEQAMSAGSSLEEIASALGGEVKTATSFTREGFVPSVGRRNAFVATAFRLPSGERSGLVDSDRGFYVLQVTERTPADEVQFAEQAEQLRGQMLNEKRQLLVTAWIEQLITQAKVTDYRNTADGVKWTPDPSMLVYASPSA
jgi:hypothetical protein